MQQTHTLSKKSLFVTALLATSLICNTAVQAGPSKEEKVGVGIGAIIGAAAGGPVGLILGAAFGGMAGDSKHKSNELEKQQTELKQTYAQLEKMNSSLEQQQSAIAELKQRNLELQQIQLVGVNGNNISNNLALDVLFHTGSAKIEPLYEDRIKTLSMFLQTTPELTVNLGGHADARGDSEYNQELSAARANSIKQALVAYGIDASRIQVTAYGENKATAKDNLDKYALERRVDIEFSVQADNKEVAQSH